MVIYAYFSVYIGSARVTDESTAKASMNFNVVTDDIVNQEGTQSVIRLSYRLKSSLKTRNYE